MVAAVTDPSPCARYQAFGSGSLTSTVSMSESEPMNASAHLRTVVSSMSDAVNCPSVSFHMPVSPLSSAPARSRRSTLGQPDRRPSGVIVVLTRHQPFAESTISVFTLNVMSLDPSDTVAWDCPFQLTIRASAPNAPLASHCSVSAHDSTRPAGSRSVAGAGFDAAGGFDMR
ncbi:Uncharacterised protein [Bifidobacterium longum subsp. infantis]|uniref:hypothetical protein n=1 Tax=Bifidobacterium longum TaxID=216816 RepID=UPI000D915687|nr:hypothetical protein [Bifidobacterium longum subsp. infantis]SPU40149.1 Uncharacterised protein [Bifidobacterium longum subsp. infantis]